MAKRTNILITIEREMNNGKTFIDKNGFFVTEETIKKDVRESFLDAMKKDPSMMDKGVTLAEFEKTYSNDFTPAKDVFETILSNLFPNQNIFVKNEEVKEDVKESKLETEETKEKKKK